MTVPVAKLVYLTQPERGVTHLNLQVEGRGYDRFELTKDQLRGIAVKSVEYALQERA